jgi:hypothetical protein
MNDVNRWKLHGPVRNLRSELAERNSDLADWQPPKRRVLAFERRAADDHVFPRVKRRRIARNCRYL